MGSFNSALFPYREALNALHRLHLAVSTTGERQLPRVNSTRLLQHGTLPPRSKTAVSEHGWLLIEPSSGSNSRPDTLHFRVSFLTSDGMNSTASTTFRSLRAASYTGTFRSLTVQHQAPPKAGLFAQEIRRRRTM